MQCLKDVLHRIIPQAIDLAHWFVARLRVWSVYVGMVLWCSFVCSTNFYNTFFSKPQTFSHTQSFQYIRDSDCLLHRYTDEKNEHSASQSNKIWAWRCGIKRDPAFFWSYRAIVAAHLMPLGDTEACHWKPGVLLGGPMIAACSLSAVPRHSTSVSQTNESQCQSFWPFQGCPFSVLIGLRCG